MTTEKLTSVFQFYFLFFAAKYKDCGTFPEKSEKYPCSFPHLGYMCKTSLEEHIPNGNIDKAMRWLGYIQGACVALDLFTLEDVKNHSRPL